jgi:PAS domain S-box-containing protein
MKNRYSLYTFLTLGIVIAVGLIMSIFATYRYIDTKERIIKDMKNISYLTIDSLKNSVQTYIEAYSPSEYEKLILNQMSNKNILAIVVEDYNMGKILAQEAYISGKIVDLKRNVVDYDSKNKKHLELVTKSFYQIEQPILDSNHNKLGKITLYLSDYYMKLELENVIIGNVISSIAISVLLIITLFVAIKLLILKPISNIVATILQNSAKDGIPISTIPTHGSKEIYTLSNTMNNMIDTIRTSRQTLEEREKRYSSLLDSMMEFVFIKDSNLRYIVINKALKDFFNMDYKDIIGKTDLELMDSENSKACLKSDQDVLQEGKAITSEETIGNQTYETHKFPVPLDADHMGIGGFIVNITDKKAKDLQILEAKNKLEVTIAASKIGIWEWDIKKDVIIWDKNCYEMFGYKHNEFTLNYEKWSSLVHPEDIQNSNNDIQLQLLTHDTFSIEFRYKKADGSWTWVEGRGKVILKDTDGKPIKLVGTNLDITKIKEYENILKEEVSKKTKELNDLNLTLQERVAVEVEKNRKQDAMLQQQSRLAAMGEMMGNIAHQWRQPLSAITTAISSLKLKEEFGILEPNDIKDANDYILNQADFLSKTIENFRNFFRKDQPKKQFALSEAINNTLGIIKASYDNNFIILDTILDDSLYYTGSENLLSQVLLNILSNAKDALVSNNIEDKHVCITLMKKNDNSCKITIKDNAGGVKDDIKDRIFDPYFTTKHPSQGTGLGLYMSSQILRNHFNGTVKVVNTSDEFGTGACFIIEFPLINVEEAKEGEIVT